MYQAIAKVRVYLSLTYHATHILHILIPALSTVLFFYLWGVLHYLSFSFFLLIIKFTFLSSFNSLLLCGNFYNYYLLSCAVFYVKLIETFCAFREKTLLCVGYFITLIQDIKFVFHVKKLLLILRDFSYSILTCHLCSSFLR